MNPFPWQKQAVYKTMKILRSENPYVANLSDMGTGKTYVSLFAIRDMGMRAAVVCPASAAGVWEEALGKVGVPCLFIESYQWITMRGAKRRKPKSKQYTIIPPWQYGHFDKHEKLTWNLPDDVVLILDEAHACSGDRTKTSRILEATRTCKVPTIDLTATLADSPIKMRAFGYQQGLHNDLGYRRWCLDNFCVKGDFGGLFYVGGRKHMEKLRKEFDQNLIRITIESLGDAFPKVQNQSIALKINKNKSLNTEYEKLLNEQIEDAETAALEAMRWRQKVELQKADVLVEMITDLLAEDKSVPVFLNFKESLNHLSAKLKSRKVGHQILRGGMGKAERTLAIKSFQEDKDRVILIMNGAGSASISLHDLNGRYQRVALISPPTNPVVFRQSLGRIHRSGALSTAINKVVFAKGTAEEKIKASLDIKLNNLDALNGKDLLTDFEEKLATLYPTRVKYDSDESEDSLEEAEDTPITTQENMNKESLEEVSSLDDPIPKDKPEEINHADRAHAEFGPSGLKNRKICPGYKSDNDAPLHPTTIQGTKLHEALEAQEFKHLTKEEKELVEMADEVVNYFAQNYTGERQDEIRLRFLQGTEHEQFGTADVFLLSEDGKKACLMDYKFGFNQVEDASENMQGKAYGLGVFEHYPKVEEVEVVFIQPRCDFITHHTYSRKKDFKNLTQEITSIIKACKNPEHTLNPDCDNCRFCARNGTCPATIAFAKKVAEKIIDKEIYTIPDSIVDLETCEDEDDLADMLKIAFFLENWVKTAKKVINRRRIEDGIDIPGFRLVEKKGAINITDARIALECYRELTEVDDDTAIMEVLDCAKVSLSQLSKHAEEHAPTGEKKKVRELLEGLLDDNDALSMGGVIRYLEQERSTKSKTKSKTKTK